jgi:hypothetical protein
MLGECKESRKLIVLEARQNTIRDKGNAQRKEENAKKDSKMNDRLQRRERSKSQLEQWPCPRPVLYLHTTLTRRQAKPLAFGQLQSIGFRA